jgi:FkbM family methyltransferase
VNAHLTRALLKSRDIYSAVLPYNLNWAIRPYAATLAFLRDDPLVVLDVGCRGGPPRELDTLRPGIHYIGMDADAEECRRLEAMEHGLCRAQFLPYFVGEREGSSSFYLYRERGRSSAFRIDERYASITGEDLSVAEETTVRTSSLDTIFEREALPAPDFMKLDTQGSELGILRGASQVLSEVNLVETEVEFVPVYRGQPLFHDVHAFMLSQGFELLYLNRVFSARSHVYRWPARGQVVFGDALYGRRDDRLGGQAAARLVRYALLLLNYGHPDIAFQILREHPEAERALPGIKGYFKPTLASRLAWRWSAARKLLRAAQSARNKLLCLMLHLNRFNGLPTDSDRSWPVR